MLDSIRTRYGNLLTPEAAKDELCKRDPLYWLQNWTKTENPQYLKKGLQFREPFPSKSYFVPLLEGFRQYDRLFIPKSRDMMTSWAAMGWATHQAQWFQAEVIVQTDSEDKAKELVGYSEQLYRNQAQWLQDRHELACDPSQLEQRWRTGGRVFGIPKGENKIRMYHPTIYIMDEAAFLPEAEL